MRIWQRKAPAYSYVLVGPPNVGKSTFFNKLTWKISPVANMDHFTTTVNEARLRGNESISIIDLPGLTTFSHTGYDEEVTIDYLLNNVYQGAINIVSALSLNRDLLLTIRIAEAGILNNIIINMTDELDTHNTLNLRELEFKFKVPVTCISAKKNENINGAITATINATKNTQFKLNYEPRIEAFLKDFENLIPIKKLSKRFIGLEALQKKEFAIKLIQQDGYEEAFNELIKTHQIQPEDINSINVTRNQFINEVVKKTKRFGDNYEAQQYYLKSKKVDNFFMRPWVAIPGFILLMAIIYFLTFFQYTGGWIKDRFEEDALGALQDVIRNAITTSHPTTSSTWWGAFVADGLLGGIFTIISFLPWIIILFVSISIVEQVGILSRLSIVFDNVFKKRGLSGRALVNLITGVGCNIPGMLLSRNITNKKERIISVMTSSLISCSARVVVYGFISEAIIGGNWGWLLSLAITGCSILFAIIVANFFSQTIFRNTTSLFICQIPRWRGLDIMVILKRTGLEVWNFLKRTIIIVGILNFVVWILLSTGPNSRFILNLEDANYIEGSFLYYLSYPFRYLLYPIGLGFDFRWSVTLLSCFPAKEAAASTIQILFGEAAQFKDILFSSATSHGYPVAVLTSFLIFFTFFVPCLASVVVMKKEIGTKYTLMSIGIILLFTYLLSWIAFVVIAAFYMVVNQTQSYYYMPLILMILCFVIMGGWGFVNHFRVNRQNAGKLESIKKFINFKKINYVLGISSLLLMIIATILLLL